MRTSMRMRGAAAALGAAVAFGSTAPAAKVLLAHVEPLMLGAVLYLGAGVGLTIVRLVVPSRRAEAALRRADVPLLVGVATFGAIVAPLLLLTGLRRVSAVTGSLLLNLESPFTVALAVVWFGEHLGGRAALGTVAMLLGAVTLCLGPDLAFSSQLSGVVAVAGACLAWAIDNNLMQRLALRDPLRVAQAKGLLGGGLAFVIALGAGADVPPVGTLSAGVAVGFVSYGLSVALALYAMRLIGVAREAAWFATAPFIGVVASVAVLGEPFGARELVALVFMAAGLVLLMTERHSHWHVHEPLRHDHRHVHDEHHQHLHAPDDPLGEPHAHEHTHAALAHEHPHATDVHHRHH